MASCIHTCAYIIYWENFGSLENDFLKFLCGSQSIVLVSTAILQSVLISIITYIGYKRLKTQGDDLDDNTHVIAYTFLCLLLPAIFIVIGCFFEFFGISGAWCWVAKDDDRGDKTAKKIFGFSIYGLIILTLSFNFTITVKILCYFHKEKVMGRPIKCQEICEFLQYPFAQLLYIIPSGTNRLIFFIWPELEITFLTWISAITTALQGVFYVLAYAYTKSVKRDLKRILFCHHSVTEEEEEDEVLSNL